VFALGDLLRRGWLRLPPASRCKSGPPLPSDPMLLGQNAAVRRARFHEHGPGPVPEQRIRLDVVRVEDAALVSPPMTSARSLSRPSRTPGRDECVHEPGTGGFHFDRRADHAEPVLHQDTRWKETTCPV